MSASSKYSMIGISDLIIKERWPQARRWAEQNYGPYWHCQLRESDLHCALEDLPYDHETKWAMYSYSRTMENGDIHVNFFIRFRDPEAEILFALKWL